jgi:cytochrome c-type biogenesis protein CcmH
MTVFWSIAAVMMMVALAFVLPPLMRTRKVSAVSRDDLNTKVIKEQLAELEYDLASGKLDQTQFDAARKDLERELLYDLDADNKLQTATSEHGGRWITLVLIPAIPACAILLYQLMGSVELIDRISLAHTASSQQAQQQAQQVASIDEMVARLAARLEQQPDDLKGWTMLARSYTILKRYSEAEVAYENVLRLSDENAAAMADYADAMVMANGGTFTDKAGALLTRALELEPGNIKALWLAGHWKNQSGAYAEALEYWQQAALKLPAGSQDATVIGQQISTLQQKLGINAAPVATAQAATRTVTDDTQGATLTVHVSLAPDIAAAAAAEDTVFIFARAAQGPRMPLAIVRKQVKDLPVTVTLDDSMAMAPQMVLSKFDQVTVGARVSKSGGALPVSGDLQGSVTPVATRTAEEIEITINSKVP